MIWNLLLTTDPAASADTSMYFQLILIAVMFGAMYLFIFLPQRKRDKKAAEMRNSIQVGDGVITIGGIVGRVVSVKDDTILVETGSDRTKIRFQKWAIQEVEKLEMTTTKKASEPAAEEPKKAKKKAKDEKAENTEATE